MLQKKYFSGVKVFSIDKEELLSKLKEITKRIKDEDEEVMDIFLYGSFVKNNYTPLSDIDIAIILSNSDKNFIKRQDDFIDYFSGLEMDVNIVVYTDKEFNKLIKEENPFVKEILKGKKI
ncbi:MAG: nucleotidyltransferase domain-containing protein [Candidatus Omnitrophica bacterium]|nr:nucleotidyltransferase domain-containing protein [Candidatus Omnitrophota bacterium]MCM8777685.1 nucleotidyltransferase domain-containing protein [Candidatus Omnitrophota bacterium]